jgi:hypothetical protein
MMRTVEVILVIVILASAFAIGSYFAVLPNPRQVSYINLRRLASTTLQVLDSNHDLSAAAFKTNGNTSMGELQSVLSASLPPNVIYNLTFYNMVNMGNGAQLHTALASISNAEDLGTSSDASALVVASSNVTFGVKSEKIGETGGGGTLYILNCSEANSWWITGYSSSSLAADLYTMLSEYFVNTVLVQNTSQLGQLLNGSSLQGEPVQNAVIINTGGEAVPIPSGYYASSGVGYDTAQSSYARYCYTLGQRVLKNNWTWASIVGYPLYYVSNNALFPNDQNTWGIYGMKLVGPAGLNAFLQGLDNQTYSYNSNGITGSPGVVYLSSAALNYSNYYGFYPSRYQTSTRALPTSIMNTYHLTVTSQVFDTLNNWNPGALYRHTVTQNGVTNFKGALFALGLTRTPDIRLTALGLLIDYHPRLYASDYTASGTSMLVVLQLGLSGGV